MIRSLSIEDFLNSDESVVLADVRTPAEFQQGHIPGALNLPLFTNEERIQVGTTYKQIGREQAILLGFDITGPKWSDYIKQALELCPSKKIALHCWRGGMRSAAMAWALDLYGFEVLLIKGGYKEFRKWCQAQFAIPRTLAILGGMTGSGKTKLLKYISKSAQVIDLEDLAQHQGSTYGTLNRLIQPSQEQFENNLAWELFHTEPEKTLWLEDECQKIGVREIPNPLWKQMREALLIDLQIPLPQRIENLLAEYGKLDREFLIQCTERIAKRLGPEQTKQAVLAIREARMKDFMQLVLVYYDKTYRKALAKRNADNRVTLELEGKNIEQDAASLLVVDHTKLKLTLLKTHAS